jgi:predicted DNA-binding transcriptional regulator AlpA
MEKVILILQQILQELAQSRIRGNPPVQLLAPKTCASMLDCSESAILKGARTGQFPKPDVKLFRGSKGLRWKKETVEDFVRLRYAGEVAQDEAPAGPYIPMRKSRRKVG